MLRSRTPYDGGLSDPHHLLFVVSVMDRITRQASAAVGAIKKVSVNSAQTGWQAARAVAEKLPSVDQVLRRDNDGAQSEAPEYILSEDLSDEAKASYMSVLIWLVHSDDDLIDERELCEIQLQMTRLGCGADVRRKVRSCLKDPRSVAVESQLELLLRSSSTAPSDEVLKLRCALMKDAVRVCRATSDGHVLDQRRICRLAELLELDGKKVAFYEEECVAEEKIFSGALSDKQMVATAKTFAEKAAAVGIPVAALYVSGSVTGFSAAGIVSGLATLGMGGILGLSSMVTGVGVLIVGGVVVGKTVKWLLEFSGRNRASLREVMLQEVLCLHQLAIVSLGEDMAHFGKRIEELARETETNRAAIDWLRREVTLLSRSAGALRRLGERTSDLQRDVSQEPSE